MEAKWTQEFALARAMGFAPGLAGRPWRDAMPGHRAPAGSFRRRAARSVGRGAEEREHPVPDFERAWRLAFRSVRTLAWTAAVLVAGYDLIASFGARILALALGW